MECVVCNRKFPEREDYRFCDACGARLFDEKRESELRGIIEDASRALDDLAADRTQEKLEEGTYRALVSARVRDKYEAESQLALLEREKKVSSPGGQHLHTLEPRAWPARAA